MRNLISTFDPPLSGEIEPLDGASRDTDSNCKGRNFSYDDGISANDAAGPNICSGKHGYPISNPDI